MTAATSVPVVTVVATSVDFPAGATHDVLTELLEVVHRLGSGRVRGQLIEMRYNVAEDGSRLITGAEIVSSFAGQGTDADMSRHRSAIGAISTCGHLPGQRHTTEEIHR